MEKGQSSRWVITGVLFLTLGALLVSGAYFARDNILNDSERELRSIVNEPGNFYRKNVLVTGEIEDMVGNQAFTIDAPNTGKELLVISKESLEPIGGSGYQQSIVQEDDNVSVEGVVHQFNLKEMESLLGKDLLDDTFAKWEGKPVVIAEKVTPDDN